MPKFTYSILLATYNEAENIGFTVDMISEAFKALNTVDYEIVVVDDNSPDKTADVAKRLQELYPETNMRILLQEKKTSLGAAYLHGLKHIDSEFTIILDSDLSHQPHYIIDMVNKQKETDADIVSGTRYSHGGGVVFWNFKRRFLSSLSNWLIANFFSPNCTDVTGSFRLYRTSALKALTTRVYSLGYSFQMEISVLAKRDRYKVENVPIVFPDRVYGSSNMSFKELILFAKTFCHLLTN